MSEVDWQAFGRYEIAIVLSLLNFLILPVGGRVKQDI
jgi:hypothetical protein